MVIINTLKNSKNGLYERIYNGSYIILKQILRYGFDLRFETTRERTRHREETAQQYC